VILQWYNGKLRKTLFSDYYPDVTYTILYAFQILMTPLNISGISNFMNCADAPMKGSIQYNNLDNEVVIK
jgi:hypothetical protein